MNFEVIRNTVNILLESMDFVNMYGEFPLDKETLEKFHTLQSRLKREFDVLDIETEFMSSDSIEVGFYLKKLDESLSKSANGVKMMLVRQEELVQRRNMLIEKLEAENEDPVIVRYNSEIFQQVMTFRYDIEKYADSIIAGINKLHQIYESPNEVSQSQEYEESGDCLREVRRDTESVGLAANNTSNTECSNNGQCAKDDGSTKNRNLEKEQIQYNEDLLKLFRNHTDLIKKLVGKNDYEIVNKIRQWAEGALIENPCNNLKLAFARELKQAGIITLSIDRFRRLL